jgi:hypothetical protein
MVDRLLDRQVRLLEYLTSGAAIFGAERSASADHAPHGIDGDLLHLEARFSHDKRMAKIGWVLPTTLDLLRSSRDLVIRDFVEACPPVSITRLENARQFHAFLLTRWLRDAPEPAYLPDVASYELTYAAVRAGDGRINVITEDALDAPRGAIRRHPGVVILRCAYDIRPILEGHVGKAVPARRDTWLAVAKLPGIDDPLVSELSCDISELLEMLDHFADPAIFRDTPGAELLIAELEARGLLVVHR